MARLCDCRLCEPVLVRPVRPRAPVSAFPEVPVPCGSVEVRDGVRPEPQRGVREARHRALPDFVWEARHVIMECAHVMTGRCQ